MKSEITQLDEIYLLVASAFAQKSYAVRAKVGALIVKDGNIMSFGYNGMPKGFDNTCEHMLVENGIEYLKTNDEVLHAESNAVTKLSKIGGLGSDGATMYVTYSPCINCAKLIIQAGISRVFYNIDYRAEEGLRLLKQAGIQVIHNAKPRYQIVDTHSYKVIDQFDPVNRDNLPKPGIIHKLLTKLFFRNERK